MPAALEREIKLRFDSPADARRAVVSVGATPLRSRRLQSDTFIDTVDGRLRESRCALRIRSEGDRTVVTFKGPPQLSPMKLREEIETEVDDAAATLELFARLGYRAWFQAQKYREEFALPDVIVAVDETPVGTFIELEGSDAAIVETARRLGRGPADFIVDSYRSLFVQHCVAMQREAGDMLFPTRA